MQSVRVGLCGLAASMSVSTFAGAEVVKPVTYDMANGYTGSFHYWDDTYTGSGDRTQDGAALSGGVGQLTDDVVGDNDWAANLGNGNAYEWVGWLNVNPQITFTFGETMTFTQIAVHANNAQYGGVGIFSSFVASFSNDGVNYTSVLGRDVTAAEKADTSARYYQLDVPEITAKYVQLYFYREAQWTFISEVTFNAVPAPAGTVAFGMAALACTRRRR